MTEMKAYFPTLEALDAFLEEMANRPCEAPELSELDHGLQCAEVLKAMRPDDVELQVAGLLHDVAHGLCHIRDHAEFGAHALRDVMNDRVNALVALHVAAKRYLVTTERAYRDRLSPTSLRSFELQGGDMNAAEITQFASDPHRDDALRLREADDAAKVVGKAVPGLDAWRDALRACARRA